MTMLEKLQKMGYVDSAGSYHCVYKVGIRLGREGELRIENSKLK